MYFLRLKIKFISEFLGSQGKKGNKTHYTILMNYKERIPLLGSKTFSTVTFEKNKSVFKFLSTILRLPVPHKFLT